MPTNSDSIGNLQLPSLELDTLNDRMRRIGQALLKAGLSTGSDTSGSTVSSISQIVLTVPGILAVQSGAAPLITMPAAKAFTKMVMILGTLPIGGAVVIQLFANGAAWGPSATATGQVTPFDVSSYPAIAQDALVRLDITSVPALLSGVSYPGAELTLELR